MNRKDLTIIGHRGGSSKNGENNLDVFKQGFRNGADLIECDLNISKDDVIFIYHDPYVKINGKSIETKKLLYRDLLSSKPDICSLENLFENLGEKLYVFELKDESNYKKIIDIFEFKYKEQFIKNRFISFSAEALRYVKSKNKNIYCSYIGTSLRGNKRVEPFIYQKHIDLCTQNNFEELSGHWLTFTVKMIKKTQQNGIKVGLGPINIKFAYNYCIKNSVDSVYTDDVCKISNF